MVSDFSEIFQVIKERVEDFGAHELRYRGVGEVVSVSDAVATVYGLGGIRYGDSLIFDSGSKGMVFSIDHELVGAVLFGGEHSVNASDSVSASGSSVSVPVGMSVLGRVVNPLGEPLDGLGKLDNEESLPIMRFAPGIVDRAPVSEPLQTGLKVVDMLIPIGRGQRELIIGDRKTGKTTMAVDAILNQGLINDTVPDSMKVFCVYVAIGQKSSDVARVVDLLKRSGSMKYTTVIFASAADSALMQYVAPYSGCSMGEYFRDSGRHCLVVYDDLSKHAVAYRQISLLLRNPSGREAYPGDIFYVHSSLLERAAKMSDSMGGGSLTALPIIETQAGDISGYVPTNVISITDGQIFLESEIFHRGFRPAVNVGNSVSRVGSSAQVKAVKKASGSVRLNLAQYRELEDFAKFGSDLDKHAKFALDRGRRLMELLKQDRHAVMSVAEQVSVMFAGVNGYLDKIPVERVSDFERALIEFMRSSHSSLLASLSEDSSDSVIDNYSKVLDGFVADFCESC